MTFRDQELERQWRALQTQKQQRFLRALEVAIQAAWDDLPENERDRYLTFAMAAIKEGELVN